MHIFAFTQIDLYNHKNEWQNKQYNTRVNDSLVLVTPWIVLLQEVTESMFVIVTSISDQKLYLSKGPT
jgi:hypothetical protein